MQDWHIEKLDDRPQEKDLAVIREGMKRYTLQQLGEYTEYTDIRLMARDEQGTVIGTALGEAGRGWLNVSLIWVDGSYRKRGLGSCLLERFEAEGIKQGCHSAYLDTFSYQARPFYEKHGYHVFGTLEDYPPGHQRYFMQKRLQPS